MNIHANDLNPLRAPYLELGGRPAMEAIANPAVMGAAAGQAAFIGAGGVLEGKTAAEALQALGVELEKGRFDCTLSSTAAPPTDAGGNAIIIPGIYVRVGELVYVAIGGNNSGFNISEAGTGTPTLLGLPYTPDTTLGSYSQNLFLVTSKNAFATAPSAASYGAGKWQLVTATQGSAKWGVNTDPANKSCLSFSGCYKIA